MASKRMTGEWRVDRAAYADGAAFVEGTFVPVAEARVPILDWGFLRSDATYDVAHVWRGAFFRLEDHLDRFERSMDRLPRHRDVALHRGERDPEGAGGLALCHASPGYRFVPYSEALSRKGSMPAFAAVVWRAPPSRYRLTATTSVTLAGR